MIEDKKEKGVNSDMKCSRCGGILSPDQDKCNECGYINKKDKEINEDKYSKKSSDELNEKEESLKNNNDFKCVKCGSTLIEGQLYCFECDTKQPEQAIYSNNSLLNFEVCHICNTQLKENQYICPNCGAHISKISGEDSKNKYTHKYIDSSGNQFESNGFINWGVVCVFISFFAGIATLVDGSGLGAFVFFLLTGATLIIIGSYRIHLGKVELRNEILNEEKLELSEELKEDGWDKVNKGISNAKKKVTNIFSDNKKQSLKEQLTELKELLDEGLITENEYDNKRNKLLDLD
jgi:predicted RNA-binding Zn-ribbon protein involved in translation (DUF1610 family)